MADKESHLKISELLHEARNGASECLGQLLQYYGNYLKILVSTHIDDKLRTRCSPSDIVQETYCDAHRDFAKFRGNSEEEFLAWLRAILANNLGREVEKHILTAKRDVRREISLAEMGKSLERSAVRLESFLVDHSPSPSSHIHRHERMIQLANHLAAMPEDYRRILILRHCEGLPFKEIAQKMARSEGAVRMLWLRAIGYMRERLSGGELS